MKQIVWSIGVIFNLCACSSMVRAAGPIQWSFSSGGNGHYYEYVSSSKKWMLARYDALSRTFNGLPGYLATITSPQENTFVTALLSTNGAFGAWLGGTDIANEGWVWADGPEAGMQFWSDLAGNNPWPNGPFAAWDTGEPNSKNEGQSVGMYGPAAGNGSSTGAWADLVSSDGFGYVVEYSGTSTTNQFASVTIYRSVDVEWESISNRLYQVQWARSLSSATWFNLGVPVLSLGQKTSITDRVPAWDQKFYRVLSLQ